MSISVAMPAWAGGEGGGADLSAFSLGGCQIAGAQSDPRKGRHQEPRRAGNQSDPSVGLSTTHSSSLRPLHALLPFLLGFLSS